MVAPMAEPAFPPHVARVSVVVMVRFNIESGAAVLARTLYQVPTRDQYVGVGTTVCTESLIGGQIAVLGPRSAHVGIPAIPTIAVAAVARHGALGALAMANPT